MCLWLGMKGNRGEKCAAERFYTSSRVGDFEAGVCASLNRSLKLLAAVDPKRQVRAEG